MRSSVSYRSKARAIRLVLMDRDGTIHRVASGRRYAYGDDAIQLVDGAADFIRAVNQSGIPVAVVSNQQGVALPEFPSMTMESVEQFNRRLNEELAHHGAHVDRYFICPHAADSGCCCHKPQPGLLLDAMDAFGVSADDTMMIGDSESDLAAAEAAGVRGYQLDADPARRFHELESVLRS